LLLVGSLLVQYWSKAAAYRYAWHSLYYVRKEDEENKRNEAKVLKITRDQMLNCKNGNADFNKSDLLELKKHMKLNFLNKQKVNATQMPVLGPMFRNVLTFLQKNICVCWRSRAGDYEKFFLH
jgi:hypothetical protein